MPSIYYKPVERKICTQCGLSKPVKTFKKKYDRPAHPERRDAECAVCRDGRQRQKIRSFIREYWQSHPCVDCGEKDLDVLEFDHRDPSTKKNKVPRCRTFQQLKTEIEKCDVRCANCHRRRHAKERRSKEMKCTLQSQSESQW